MPHRRNEGDPTGFRQISDGWTIPHLFFVLNRPQQLRRRQPEARTCRDRSSLKWMRAVQPPLQAHSYIFPDEWHPLQQTIRRGTLNSRQKHHRHRHCWHLTRSGSYMQQQGIDDPGSLCRQQSYPGFQEKSLPFPMPLEMPAYPVRKCSHFHLLKKCDVLLSLYAS